MQSKNITTFNKKTKILNLNTNNRKPSLTFFLTIKINM